MPKKILFIFLFLSTIGGAFGYYALYEAEVSLSRALEENYLATEVKGQVEYRRSDSTAWKPLKMGTTLHEGDMVRSGPTGSADLLFMEGRAMRIKPNTTLMVASDRKQGEVVNLLVGKGQVLARVITGALGAAKPDHEILTVQTPVATMGIRGTSFMVEYSQAGGSRLLVRDGTVNLRSNSDPSLNIDVVAGMKGEMTFLTTELEAMPLTQQEWQNLGEIDHIPTSVALQQLLRSAMKGNIDLGELVSYRDAGHQGMIQKIQGGFEEQKAEITRFEMQNIAKSIRIKSLLDGTPPNTLAELDLESGNFTDSWGTRYLYYPRGEQLTLLSAGPNKQFGDDDDIKLSISPR
ncbi:FecR family protein [Endothiovibrio diazotrophicus]